MAAGPVTGDDLSVLAGPRSAREVITGATRGRGVFDSAQDVRGEDVGRKDFELPALRLMDQSVRRIEAHRLLIEQTA